MLVHISRGVEYPHREDAFPRIIGVEFQGFKPVCGKIEYHGPSFGEQHEFAALGHVQGGFFK